MGFATSREQQRSKAQLGLGPNPEEQPPAVQPGAGSPCPSAQHEANVGDSSLLVPLSQKCRAGLSCVQVSAPEAEPALCNAGLGARKIRGQTEASSPPFVSDSRQDMNPAPIGSPQTSAELRVPAELLLARCSHFA